MNEPRIVAPAPPQIRTVLDTRAAADYSAKMAHATFELAQAYLEETKEIRKLLQDQLEVLKEISLQLDAVKK